MRKLFDRSPAQRPRSRGALAVGIALCLLVATGAAAVDGGGGDVPNRPLRPRLGVSLVDIELPLEFKARFNGIYTRTRHAIDALAYNRWGDPGPAVLRDSLVESRLSIGREIAPGLELEVAWATQSPLDFESMPSPDRQTVGAFFRFTR